MHPRADRVEVMAEKPKRKIKPGYDAKGRKKAPPPKLTTEEIQAQNLAKVEARHNITPHLVSTMILKQRGTLTNVARALKVPRQTLQRYIDKHAECLYALDHAREAMGDKAEMKLFEAIDRGDTRCILFYLSTVHRHRGYAMRPDLVDPTADPNGRGPVFVETVNIVGIPSGTFLPKETLPLDGSMVIDNQG
jgi:hypothetical protein